MQWTTRFSSKHSINFCEVLKLAGVEDYNVSWELDKFHTGQEMIFATVYTKSLLSITALASYFNTRLRKNWREQLLRSCLENELIL